MRPIAADKKMPKKTVSNPQQEVLARRRRAGYTQTQHKNANSFLGRRKEWPYVETLKSRREETKSGGHGAKAARDVVQNVAFWPHCRFGSGKAQHLLCGICAISPF